MVGIISVLLYDVSSYYVLHRVYKKVDPGNWLQSVVLT